MMGLASENPDEADVNTLEEMIASLGIDTATPQASPRSTQNKLEEMLSELEDGDGNAPDQFDPWAEENGELGASAESQTEDDLLGDLISFDSPVKSPAENGASRLDGLFDGLVFEVEAGQGDKGERPIRVGQSEQSKVDPFDESVTLVKESGQDDSGFLYDESLALLSHSRSVGPEEPSILSIDTNPRDQDQEIEQSVMIDSEVDAELDSSNNALSDVDVRHVEDIASHKIAVAPGERLSNEKKTQIEGENEIEGEKTTDRDTSIFNADLVNAQESMKEKQISPSLQTHSNADDKACNFDVEDGISQEHVRNRSGPSTSVVSLVCRVGNSPFVFGVRANVDVPDPIGDFNAKLARTNLPESTVLRLRNRFAKYISQTVHYDQALRKRAESAEQVEIQMALWESKLKSLQSGQKEGNVTSWKKIPRWFRKDSNGKDLVYRQSMSVILKDELKFSKVCKHEMRCNKELNQTIEEKEGAKKKLREVQLHEMQFMCESLAAGNGVTESDVEKLGLSHWMALEKQDQALEESLKKLNSRFLSEHRALILSLAGSQEKTSNVELGGHSGSKLQLDIPEVLQDEMVGDKKPLNWKNMQEVIKSNSDSLRKIGLAALDHTSIDPVIAKYRYSKEENLNVAQPQAGPMANLMMGNWVGDWVTKPKQSIANDNTCRDSLSTLSTSTHSLETYLGAQKKVLFRLQVETVIGGLLWALTDTPIAKISQESSLGGASFPTTKEKPFEADNVKEYIEWRRKCLGTVYDPPSNPGFVAVAMPAPINAENELNERLVSASRHCCELHFSTEEHHVGSHPTVAESWHSNFGMSVICALHSRQAKRDDGIRAVLEHASSIGVSHLIIPLREWVLEASALQVESEAMKSGNFERTRLNPKAVTKLFRAVKASLSNIAHRDECKNLRTVTFLLKSSCSSYQDGMKIIAATTQTDKTENTSRSLNNPDSQAVKKITISDQTITEKAKSLLEKIFEN